MGKKYGKYSGWKRILSCLLALFLCVQSAPIYIKDIWAAVENPWDGVSMEMPETDSDGVFLITAAAELAWFAEQVNSGNNAINGRLENTIYLNDHDTKYNWMMIGNSEQFPYKGNFDGNGQKINFMYVVIDDENPSYRYGGLFGVIDGGTVSNLSVSGTVVHGYGTYGKTGELDECYTAAGGVAGYLKSGKISGCVNYANMEMEEETAYRNVGGIVGLCSGSVLRCTNQGEISTDVAFAQRHIGGIAGMVYGTSGQIRYCDNRSSVKGYFEVGGISGAVKYGGEIQYSCNYGEVIGNSILGGIAGNVSKTGTYSNGSVKECVIRNVYSLGTISEAISGTGTVAGGIIGQMGYEDGSEVDTPSLPVLENAYATVQYINGTYSSRGAVVGYFKSGSIGNVYGMTGSDLSPCGVEETKSTSYSGSVLMKSETNLKSVSMISLLGDAFVKTNKYDYDNEGFPKLAWQGQTSDLAEKADEAYAELNSWLTEENRLKYGSAYLSIEAAVEKYVELLGTVVTDSDLETIMTQARETLEAIKSGTEEDTNLAAAIDEGILTLEAYLEELLEAHPDFTEEQLQQLQTVLKSFTDQLESAADLDAVTLLIRDGKDGLDEKAASFEEEKRLEEVRLNAKNVLEAYCSEDTYGESWDAQIAEARTAGLAALDQAATVSEVKETLEQAKAAIDEIINQIPSEGAWDGVTLAEPEVNAQGVYQVSSGAELAWFAYQVNQVSGMQGICGELTGDVNLGNKNWTPIGGKTVYTGTFEGNGHTVKGMKITEADTYAGLFGAVSGNENQSIVNLTVTGTISCPENVSYAGGIVGYICGESNSQRNAIENCHSQVNITISKVTKNDSAAGGIAGYAKYTWFRNCSNQGTVAIDSVGKGGIQYFTGGIAGHAASAVSIRRCYNSGYIWTDFGAGGLVGKVSGNNCEFTSNYNCGEVQATTYAGGLVGVMASTADGSSVKWSYNSGPVNLNKNGEYTGAVAGRIYTGTFEGIYALKRSDQSGLSLVGVSADSTAPGTFVSSAELQRDTMLNALNSGGNYFIKDYLGFQNGYPILSWQLTLSDFKAGSITELQTFVSEDEYTAENWVSVKALIASGIERIQNSSDMDGVNAALTETKAAIYEVESKADTYARLLQEAKDQAIETLETYTDRTLYREEEQMQIDIYLSDAVKRISLAETLEQVEEYLTQTKDKIDRLPTEEEYRKEQDAAAAAQVDSYILNIGEVVYADYVKTSINIARNAYDQLTEDQKMLVTQYQTLLDAEAAYALLAGEYEATEEDKLLAAQVDALIDAIGEVSLNSDKAIETARHGYDALTDLQKTLVSNPEVLVAAEQKYNELRAREVSAAIASIGEVTLEKEALIRAACAMYDALTEAQKALVTDYDTLVKAKETYVNLTAAQSVIDMIDQIGVVTLDSETIIKGAITAYNALTGTQQGLVTNYYLLEQAAAEFDSLCAIAKTEQYIDQIGAVNSSSGSLIQRARVAYDALSDSQKSKVSNLAVLEAAEKAFAALNIGNNGETTKPVGSVADAYKGSGTSTEAKTLSGVVGATGSVSGNASSGTSGSGSLVSVDPVTGELIFQTENTSLQGETYLPEWWETESSSEANVSADMAMEKITKQKKQKEHIAVLGVILGTFAAITVAAGTAMHLAGKKRKEKKVQY